METQVTIGPSTLIRISGRLDTVNSPEFEKQIEPVLESEMHDVLVDCSGMTYISSSGLRLFLKLQKTCLAKTGSLKLRGMTPEVKDVFDMTGFTSLFIFE